ncbi:PREDICTED: mitochondrial-processing peptidase subunit alpha-like [Wasmannia auropunctata]|uniref:mitochondrial-processing peptidase subunit alpha-like n=1 Tax=Wasmannia auropunctata TaxID=64793 RepID=UPI0005EEB2CF|nr:PREDICTED: mitochondrial-processing peptidase subunit alpha-like [Wasmannia auropunctata]
MFSRMLQRPLIVTIKKSSTRSQYLDVWQRCNSSQRIPDLNLKQKQKKFITSFPPLTKPIPNLPRAVYSTAKEDQTTQITVLSNGLKVASENRFGQICTIGVLIDSGPRYEVAYPKGISHFLEKLAFNSSNTFDSKTKIMVALEKYGGICECNCQVSRDTFVYAVSAERRGLDRVTQILGDVVLKPQITEEEVRIARQIIYSELESLYRPEQEILMDMIHSAAYGHNTLGFPNICPKKNIEKIDRKILHTYLKHHYVPSRMVVAGVGVEHDDLVHAVTKYFVDQKSIWEEQPDLILPNANTVDMSIAQYTGGCVLEEYKAPICTSGLPELSHIVIGLEGCSHQDSDFVAMWVLTMMMGSGGSFSADSPGIGMYTRLYTNVVNKYGLYSATACNFGYADTGLFFIHASCASFQVKDMVEVIVHEMITMTKEISDSELARAKKQLQSMLLMKLEHRFVVFEDIGRHILATGFRKRPEYFIQAIDKISKDDINRVARRLLKSPPCLAVLSRGEEKASWENIQNSLFALLDALQGRFSFLFRKIMHKIF